MQGYALYSRRSSIQSKSLESCFNQSPSQASKSSASCGIQRLDSSNYHCLEEEENGFDRESTPFSQSFKSLLSPLDSSTSNQPLSLTHRAYPRVFSNPVSHCENQEPNHTQEDSSTRNYQDSQVDEEIESLDTSHSTSINDMLVDVERSNETEVETPSFGSMTQHRCGVCKKLLSQRSPWCSYKLMRCGDMPSAGIFPCHHIFHVECLDKVTPTSQTREPLCPVCPNTIEATERQGMRVPETLELALRSLRRSSRAMESELLRYENRTSQSRRRRRRKWEKLSCCWNISL